MPISSLNAAILATTLAVSGIAIYSETSRESRSPAEPSHLVPVLDTQAESSALEPNQLQSMAEAGLETESLRFLSESKLGLHWVATDRDERICIVTELPTDGTKSSALGGVACRSAVHFYQGGASLRLEASDVKGAVVHLLPADVGMASIRESLPSEGRSAGARQGIEVIDGRGSSLVIMTPAVADTVGDISISRPEGNDIVLPRLEAG